ncbi:DUF1127 domain-containing protein [Azospirillum canadense]|uniref:DUF1127 domain-containing protein n=1 Tax=Azospirillum canadense TaxID=403962 RepID=UPI0022271119|nr:DUF1127 domain-containing protein [Azospirillum canadense]MCW2243631.1 uncharacterized protein YjiS (DUF1127 family) [Azospirillum canadense]
MTQSMNTVAAGASTRSAASVGRSVVALFDMVATWNERRRQRLALEALPDHLLHDIGLSRADAENEAEKPFWKG